MKKLFTNFDWGILSCLLVLLTLSLAMIKSVAPDLFNQQLLYSFLGLLIFFLFSQIDYRLFSRFGLIFYLFSLIGLVSTFIFGFISRGSIRWIGLGSFTFQPSELVKPLLIISFASFFASERIYNLKYVAIGLLLLIPPVFLIFVQPDLGSSLVIIFLWLGIFIASGVPFRLLFGLITMTTVFLPLSWLLLKPYQRERILSFLNPFSDPLGSGYSMIQAMIAVGSGQFFGRGLGRGTQSHLRFLPEHHTDFIFASLSEELGFLGAGLLIIFYAFLLWRIIKIAGGSRDTLGSLISLGVFSMIFIQVIVNSGMNLGLLPVTGITLPLVSSGGSSLLATTISLGIVESIARLKKKNQFLSY